MSEDFAHTRPKRKIHIASKAERWRNASLDAIKQFDVILEPMCLDKLEEAADVARRLLAAFRNRIVDDGVDRRPHVLKLRALERAEAVARKRAAWVHRCSLLKTAAKASIEVHDGDPASFTGRALELAADWLRLLRAQQGLRDLWKNALIASSAQPCS